MNRPTPETDALAENLIPIVEKITEFNAQYVIKQILTEILTKTTKIERERDEAWKELEEYRSIAENIGAKKAVSEKEKAIREHDEAREALSSIALYLSVGMGDETTTAQQYEQRILDGIKMLTEPIADLWKQAEKECNKMREALMAIEDRCVDCEDACDDIQKIRDIARAALEK